MTGRPRHPRAVTHAVLSTAWLARHTAAMGGDPGATASWNGFCVVWVGGVRPRMRSLVAVGEPLLLALPPGARVLTAWTDGMARRACAQGDVVPAVADDRAPAVQPADEEGAPPPSRVSLTPCAEEATLRLLRLPLVAHAGDPEDGPPRGDADAGAGGQARHDWLWDDDPHGPEGWPPAEAPPDLDPPGVRVLRAVPPTEGADAAEVPGLRRLAALARPLPAIPAPGAGEVAARLMELFPWMGGAVAIVRRELALRPPGGPAAIAPLLLVGEPGSGKTAFARALLTALGVPSRVVPVADGGAVSVLAGAGRGWRAARPALALELMLAGRTATVGLVVDDVDREPIPALHGSVAAWLLGVLEPSVAGRFHDPFLQVECDLRMVTWVLTANDTGLLPEALRDRCVEVQVDRPPPWALPGVVRRMAAEVLEEAGWGGMSEAARPVLGDDVVAALLREATREGDSPSLRPLRRAVRAALAAARLGEDPAAAGRAELRRGARAPGGSGLRIGYRAG